MPQNKLTRKEDFINEFIQVAKEKTPGFNVDLISDGDFTFEEYRYFITKFSDTDTFIQVIQDRREKELVMPKCVKKSEEA